MRIGVGGGGVSFHQSGTLKKQFKNMSVSGFVSASLSDLL